jgi:hypothetical protein
MPTRRGSCMQKKTYAASLLHAMPLELGLLLLLARHDERVVGNLPSTSLFRMSFVLARFPVGFTEMAGHGAGSSLTLLGGGAQDLTDAAAEEFF